MDLYKVDFSIHLLLSTRFSSNPFSLGLVSIIVITRFFVGTKDRRTQKKQTPNLSVSLFFPTNHLWCDGNNSASFHEGDGDTPLPQPTPSPLSPSAAAPAPPATEPSSASKGKGLASLSLSLPRRHPLLPLRDTKVLQGHAVVRRV
jgi:hypothetical protein